ncbi:Na+/H+ antiporter NhaC family protein [Georgenia alba]|uniref:Na+/H+ antiporter NhaC family protein n=1 Tax=Georgenia alba TaxID=2233858 RepID=A0ABW2Q819_9MICO
MSDTSVQSTEAETSPVRMFGGLAGAAVPPLIFIGVLCWLSIAERASTTSFWVGAAAALIVGLLLARTKRAYAESVIAGLADRTGAVIIVAFIFAGIFGAFMKEGGLVEGLLWLGLETGIQGAAFTAFAFLLAAVFGTGVGTSVGTVTALVPILFPAGVLLGSDPTMVAVAVLAGGALGDNLSPISDTTIASSYTQDATMGAVVRRRLPLALTAGAVSLVTFYAAGGGGEVAAGGSVTAESSPVGLIMLLPFALVIVLALMGRHIFESLTWGTLSALVLALLTGALSGPDIFHVPAERDESTGLVEDAILDVTGPVLLVLFVLGLTRVLADSGVMSWLLAKLQRAAARGVRSAELVIVGVSILFTIPLGANAPAILMLGPTIARPLGQKYDLAPERRANLLDCAVCTVFYMLPWHNAVIVWFGVVVAAAAEYDLDVPSIWSAGLNPYAWALLVVVVVSALTGWNRTYERTA